MLKKIFVFLLFLLISIGFALNNRVKASAVVIAPHWNKSNITVYIPEDMPKADTMQHAFQKWENKSLGHVKFEFVEEQPADIEVTFKENGSGSDSPISSYNLSVNGKTINKVDIAMYTNKFSEYSNDYIYTVMLHMVGHALGLQDTNRKASGIMYRPVNERLDITKSDVRKLFAINNWSYKDRGF